MILLSRFCFVLLYSQSRLRPPPPLPPPQSGPSPILLLSTKHPSINLLFYKTIDVSQMHNIKYCVHYSTTTSSHPPQIILMFTSRIQRDTKSISNCHTKRLLTHIAGSKPLIRTTRASAQTAPPSAAAGVQHLGCHGYIHKHHQRYTLGLAQDGGLGENRFFLNIRWSLLPWLQ